MRLHTELLASRIVGNWRYGRRARGVDDAFDHSLRNRGFVVALSHSNYLSNIGGTELYLRQEQAFLADAALSYVQLSPVGGGRLEVNVDGVPIGRHPLGAIQQAIARQPAAGRRCVAVHLHQLKGCDIATIQAFVTSLGAPLLRFFLHDYYSMCRNFNLLFGDRVFCGAPPVGSLACTICRWGSTRAEHLGEMRRLLAALDYSGTLELVSPSETAAGVFRRFWPELAAKVRVVPHQELVRDHGAASPAPSGRPRLGFVGYSDRCKGFDEWIALSSRPSIRARYELFHFGACRQPRRYVRNVEVDFQTAGPDAMRKALQSHQLDFAFLWSLWPETFSFTCYESMAAGAFVVTGEPSGNIAAQVRRTGRGRVFGDLDGVERFLVDAVAVEAARNSVRMMPRVRAVWLKTLSTDLQRVS